MKPHRNKGIGSIVGTTIQSNCQVSWVGMGYPGPFLRRIGPPYRGGVGVKNGARISGSPPTLSRFLKFLPLKSYIPCAFSIYPFPFNFGSAIALEGLMKYPERMLLKLPDGWTGRIAAASCGGSSAEFVRGAIAVALGDDVAGRVEIVGREPNDLLSDLPMKKAAAGRLLVGRSKLPDASFRTDPEKKFDDCSAGLPPDQSELLALVCGGPIMSRVAEDHFGWLGLRYQNAERGLSTAGLIRFEGGMLVACMR